MSFTDKRRFAKVRLLENPASTPPISELGPDALLQPITKDELFKSLSKKKIGIKALLLDQSYISGIGNWIADEVLYQARIHPLQIASNISKESSEALHNCIKEVIRKSVEVDADCSRFPCEWLFHYRWGKKPGKVNGKKIEFIKAGGRTTAYVPELQKLSGAQAAQAAKPIAKPHKGASKKTKDEDGDDYADEPGSEDEENAKTVKVESKKKTAKTRAKKPPAKKSNDSDEESAKADDDDNDTDDGDKELTKGGKKTIARMKSRESDKVDGNHKGAKGGKRPAKRKAVDSDDEHDDGSDGDDDKEDDEGQKKVMKRKQSKAEKIPKKKIQTVQTGKQPKKSAK